jgi:hypothetical protein
MLLAGSLEAEELRFQATGRNHRPKHVELIGIINKPLLLHLVGCLCYLYTLKRQESYMLNEKTYKALRSARAE